VAGGNQLALLVSLPAGLLGVVNVLRATYAMLQHHRIELRKDGGWITVLPIGRKTPLRTDNLRLRFDHVVRGETDGMGGIEVPVLIVEDGVKTFRLLEGATNAERRWVRAELNAWLARHGRT
jgi:hypothetical protein